MDYRSDPEVEIGCTLPLLASLAVFFGILSVAGLVAWSFHGFSIIWLIPIAIFIFFLLKVWKIERFASEVVQEEARSERLRREQQIREHREKLDGLGNAMEKMGKSIEDLEPASIRIGDIIVSGGKPNIIVGSKSIEVINGDSVAPDISKALTAILGHIEETKNREAAEYFNAMTSEIGKEEPNKTVLRSLWGSLVQAAPTIEKLSGAVAAIKPLFAD